MLITRKSMITGIERTMDLPVTEEQMAVWNGPNRPLIQDAFPNLSPAAREFIHTGITDEEWDTYIADPEDELPDYEEPAF